MAQAMSRSCVIHTIEAAIKYGGTSLSPRGRGTEGEGAVVQLGFNIFNRRINNAHITQTRSFRLRGEICCTFLAGVVQISRFGRVAVFWCDDKPVSRYISLNRTYRAPAFISKVQF